MTDDAAITAFEDRAIAAFHSAHAIAVSSGTAALHCALVALGVGAGDEVIVPALAVPMSVAPVVYRGATPVFVDIVGGDRIDIDIDDLRRKLTGRTRALLVVHLWGHAPNMDEIRTIAADVGLPVIEDACQAHGSTWDDRLLGTLGTIGCFSMKSGKLVESGEGGFLITDDPRVADTCRAFRDHYRLSAEGRFARIGMNYRLPPSCADIAAKSLARLPRTLRDRRRTYDALRSALTHAAIAPYPTHTLETPNGYAGVFLTDRPSDLPHRLATAGIANSVGTFLFRPPYLWPAFRDVSRGAPTPRAEHFAARVLALTLPSAPTAAPYVDTVRRSIEHAI
jgi:dTDP-4-amino-4,6-dideoxygalactose transaminase